MKKSILILTALFLLRSGAAQQPIAAYVYSAGSWITAVSSTTSGALSYTPPAAALYCFNSSLNQWVPADSNCFGGGGGGGGGTNVTVNGGSTLTTAAFNGTTPAAGSGYNLLDFLVNGSGQITVEAPLATSTVSGLVLLGASGGANAYLGYTPANCTAGTSGSDCLQLSSGLVPAANLPAATTSALGGVSTDGATLSNSSGAIAVAKVPATLVSGNTNYYCALFATNSTSNQVPDVATACTFNPSTGNLAATTFNGVALTTGGSSTTFLNGAGSYSTPSGSGTMSDGSGSTTAGYFPETTTTVHTYAVDTNLQDASNTLTYGGSAGVSATQYKATGTCGLSGSGSGLGCAGLAQAAGPSAGASGYDYLLAESGGLYETIGTGAPVAMLYSGGALGTPISGTLSNASGLPLSTGVTGVLPATNGGTGVNNSATLTLGSANQNWATLGTGIVKNTTTTGAISDALSSDVITLWTGSCSSSTWLNGAGACSAPAGSGTINAASQYDISYYSAAGSSTTLSGAAITGIQYDSTSGAPAAATAAQLGTLANIAQYYTLVSGGTTSAIAGVAPSSTSGIPYISQGSSANPAFGTAVIAGGGTGGTTAAGAVSNLFGNPAAANYLVDCSSTSACATAAASFANLSGALGSGQGPTSITNILYDNAGTLQAATAANVGTLIDLSQYDIPVSVGTTSALGGIAPSSTSGAIFASAGSSAIPAYDANATVSAGALSLGASGTAGSVAMGNATSGTVTLQPVTGALGTVTASLPANTGTIGELNLAQTWSALQTFGTDISIGGVTAGGATGTGNVVFSASPTLSGTLSVPTIDLGSSGALGTAVFGNATSGTVTLEPVTGALGTVTASLPANTGTLAELNYAQTWSAAQTISATNGLVLSAMSGTTCLEQVSGVVTSTGSACGGGSPALSSVTGSAAQATGTESAAGDEYTFAGVETANLTYPFSFTDANSSNNHTNGAVIIGTTGTSTGAVPLAINEATAAGNFIEMFNGGTVSNGVLSGGTDEFSVSATGTTTFGTAPTVTTPGTGWYLFGTDGTEPASVASGTSGFVMDSTGGCPNQWNNATNVGCTAALGATESFTAAQTFTGGIINTTTPIRDETTCVLPANMTAVDTAGVNIGSSGSGNSTCSWPVTSANWYEMRCEIPVTFVASATIAFELVSISGGVTISHVNSDMNGNIAASAAFQDYPTIAGTSLAGSETPVSGAPGGVSEPIHFNAQFVTTHAGNIGLEFIGNGANNVQVLLGTTCHLTQTN